MATALTKSGKFRGVFVPARAEMITSPAIYKQLLQNHNLYTDSVTSVTIEGLHPMSLDQEIALGKETVSIKEFLCTKNAKIQSMERTNISDKKGRWLKDDQEVSEFLDKKITDTIPLCNAQWAKV
eukprot:12536253-Ditylum_brightwellii.AAC.2